MGHCHPLGIHTPLGIPKIGIAQFAASHLGADMMLSLIFPNIKMDYVERQSKLFTQFLAERHVTVRLGSAQVKIAMYGHDLDTKA